MADEEIIHQLIEIKGIGPLDCWKNVIVIFSLEKDPNVFKLRWFSKLEGEN